MEDESCLFCKITRGKVEGAKIIYQDSEYAAFSDHRPSCQHHLLVCPKKHIRDAKSLKKEDLPMVQDLIRIAKQVLSDEGADMDDLRLGFHWPPFCSIHHLHLHALSPYSHASKLFGVVNKYADSPWFATASYVVQRLQKE